MAYYIIVFLVYPETYFARIAHLKHCRSVVLNKTLLFSMSFGSGIYDELPIGVYILYTHTVITSIDSKLNLYLILIPVLNFCGSHLTRSATKSE